MNLLATGHRSEFTYDGLGRRVEIVEKDPDASHVLQVASDRKYLWDGVEIAEERNATGATVQKRFYGQGFVDTDGTALFYTRDHLGSIRELTDSTQAVRARYDYDPYGRMTKISGDKDSPFTYTGHFWHAQSGLNLAKYRAYDPNLGRWLSRDLIAEYGGPNLYSYVRSNPINKVDLLGLTDSAWTIFKDAYKKAKNWKDKIDTLKDWWEYYKKCGDLLTPDPIDPFKNQPTCPIDDDPASDDSDWKQKQDDFIENRKKHALSCWKPFIDKYLGGGYGGGYGH